MKTSHPIDQAHRLRLLVKQNQIHNKQALQGVSGCTSILIAGGENGVGKSFLTFNLALALQRLGKKVCVFNSERDLDVFPSFFTDAPKYTLSHLIQNQCTLQQLLCTGPQGIWLIPRINGTVSLGKNSRSFRETVVESMKNLKQQFDFLLIDTNPGINELTIALCNLVDSSYVVVHPNILSLHHTYTTLKNLVLRKMKSISIIVNKAQSDQQGREIFEKLSLLTTRHLQWQASLATIVPFDTLCMEQLSAPATEQVSQAHTLCTQRIELLAQSINHSSSILTSVSVL